MISFLIRIAAIAMLAGTVQARVTRLIVEQRQAAGLYETLAGHFSGELDPRDPLNTIITDLQLAPRNSHGMVEYSATFSIAKPVDMSKASGLLIYQVPNRGNASVSGNSRGDVSVTSGWQGDIPPKQGLQTMSVPVAESVTGPVLVRMVNMPPNTSTMPLSAGIGSPVMRPLPVSLDPSKASLNKRAAEGSAAIPIASARWAFADCGKSPFPGTPDPNKICLKDGFDPAYLYELVYVAKNPLVLGIGYAATRDINSFLRYAEKDDDGNPNPLANHIKWAIGTGNSQSGNFVKSFIHLGFNQDESGRMVWDGANPNIAGRQNPLNFRFAVPGGAAGMYEPGSEAVLWWSDYQDETRHRPAAGMLDRCRATDTCPKIFETFGASEFWGLRMSPGLVGNDAKADIPLPPNVRRYYSPGVTHGGGRGGFSITAPTSNATGCVLPANPNPSSDTNRALMAALIDWVVKGTPPPPSRYPRLDLGQLVPATSTAMGFPTIPGAPLPDGMVNSVLDYDFGPSFKYADLAGVISLQPPLIKQVIPTLVPKVDADGNEVGGIPSVLHQAPLGTYLGWNVTASGFYKGQSCGFAGGYIPFARTKADRIASGDPRLSVEERYGTHDQYVAVVRAAAEKLVRQRFLLPDDAARLIREAESASY
jgi:hypothetical protein